MMMMKSATMRLVACTDETFSGSDAAGTEADEVTVSCLSVSGGCNDDGGGGISGGCDDSAGRGISGGWDSG